MVVVQLSGILLVLIISPLSHTLFDRFYVLYFPVKDMIACHDIKTFEHCYRLTILIDEKLKNFLQSGSFVPNNLL